MAVPQQKLRLAEVANEPTGDDVEDAYMLVLVPGDKQRHSRVGHNAVCLCGDGVVCPKYVSIPDSTQEKPQPLTTVDWIDLELGQLLPSLNVEDLNDGIAVSDSDLLEVGLDGLYSRSAGVVALGAEV